MFQSGLSHEELSVAVEMLSAVAVLNEVLDTKDPQAVIEQLTDSPLGFSNMDQENLNRSISTSSLDYFRMHTVVYWHLFDSIKCLIFLGMLIV